MEDLRHLNLISSCYILALLIFMKPYFRVAAICSVPFTAITCAFDKSALSPIIYVTDSVRCGWVEIKASETCGEFLSRVKATCFSAPYRHDIWSAADRYTEAPSSSHLFTVSKKRGLYNHWTSRRPHCRKGIPRVVYGTRCVGHNNLTRQHY